MTIRFGRRRLVLMVTDAGAPSAVETNPLPGADDRELIAYSRIPGVDPEIARWEGLGLMYGGQSHPRFPR